ncbi:unnamed protein product [Withania somnifera]
MGFSLTRNPKFMPAIKHLLIISIAINAGLVLKLLHDGHEWAGGPCQAPNGKNEGRVVKNVSHEAKPANDRYIYLDRGDPTMYEIYWKQMGDRTTLVLSGWQSISYFSDTKNHCWFLEPGFANAVTRLHKLVGNAQTRNYHIVVGTGSTQLLQAVLYALSPSNAPEPMSIVSAAPFYSSYPLIIDCLKSGLYKWKGDASKFNNDEPYIELVTSPNNPDGLIRQAVVNGSEGILVHDLAYYWPQYTPISFQADHDIMLFTVSKSTGHAGIRIGWALVKDEEVAKKMTKFIEISSIGVSKDSQLRAAKILDVIADTYEHTEKFDKATPFFHYVNNEMAKRWRHLRSAVNKGQTFSLPDFPVEKCNFGGQRFGTQPAFAWLKCEKAVDDCENFLRNKRYVRISLISHKEEYDEFIQRLSLISSMDTS